MGMSRGCSVAVRSGIVEGVHGRVADMCIAVGLGIGGVSTVAQVGFRCAWPLSLQEGRRRWLSVCLRYIDSRVERMQYWQEDLKTRLWVCISQSDVLNKSRRSRRLVRDDRTAVAARSARVCQNSEILSTALFFSRWLKPRWNGDRHPRNRERAERASSEVDDDSMRRTAVLPTRFRPRAQLSQALSEGKRATCDSAHEASRRPKDSGLLGSMDASTQLHERRSLPAMTFRP